MPVQAPAHSAIAKSTSWSRTLFLSRASSPSSNDAVLKQPARQGHSDSLKSSASMVPFNAYQAVGSPECPLPSYHSRVSSARFLSHRSTTALPSLASGFHLAASPTSTNG
jgi:hypothetical protein